MLIGLNGKAGAGKDTVADFLVNKYGLKRYAFADAVRDVALAIDPIIMTNWQASLDQRNPLLRETRVSTYVDHLGWDKAKRDIPEVRRLLQVIGTEAGRQILGENVWVQLLSNKWYNDGCPNAVVTDLRFPNEFHWVNDVIYECTVKIVRPDNPLDIGSSHESERYEPECKHTLVNDGSLSDLEAKVDKLVEEINVAGRL